MLAYLDRDLAALVVADANSGRVRFQAPIRNPGAPGAPLALVTLGGPTWAPDGSRIAFNCWDGRGDELCVIGKDGSGRRQVTQLEPPASGRSATQDPSALALSNVGPAAWSPDGKSIAVAAYAELRGSRLGSFSRRSGTWAGAASLDALAKLRDSLVPRWHDHRLLGNR
jgi:hypothetical protein